MTIGRDNGCDWMLADPDRSLSRQHCRLERIPGGWQLRDLSANGTFVNFATTPLGRDNVRPLQDGDRIRLGDYELELRVIEAPAPAPPPAPSFSSPAPASGGFGGASLPGLDDPPAASPFGPLSAGPALPGLAQAGPSDFIFGDEPAPPAVDAFMPSPAKALVPDDWWSAEPSPPTPAPVAAPPPSPTPPRPQTPPMGSAPDGSSWPPLEPGVPTAMGDQVVTLRAHPPAAVTAPVPRPAPGVLQAGPAHSATAIGAFVEGGGLLPESAQRLATDPDALLQRAGQLLRSAVSGLRALLVARGLVKREFRIEQTLLRPSENNPLKFAATDEQALTALLDARMGGPQAVADAVADLTAHEVAVMSATQAAARAMIQKLAPETIEAEDGGGGGLFGLNAERRLWQVYKRRHAVLAAQLEDDFESAFGIAFAKAYEEAIRRGRPGA